MDPLYLINDLFESRMFSSRNSMKQYTVEDIANMAFLNFLALQILKSDFDTADFATDYLYSTFSSGNFKTLRGNASDLFWLMYVLESGDISLLKDHGGNELELQKINLNDASIYSWARTSIKGRLDVASDRRFLIALERMLNIRNGDYKSVRLMASEWTTLTDEQRQLTMTRLLMAVRKRMPRSELLHNLEVLASHKKLEIAGANNPEEEDNQPTKGSLVKKLAIGAAIGAAIGLPILAARNRYKEFKSKIDAIPVNRFKLGEDASCSATTAGSIATVVQPMMTVRRVKRGDRKKKAEKK